jgi:hypothetical protein
MESLAVSAPHVSVSSRIPIWAAWSGAAAGVVGLAGVVLLVLFYIIQVPHLRPSAGGWGSNPGASLGYANDVSGIVFDLLLVPLVVLLWRLGGTRTRSAKVVMVLGAGSSAIGAAAAIAMVTNLLAESAASDGINVACALVIAIWVALWSRSARHAGWPPARLVSLGQVIAVAILGSALLVAASFLTPRSGAGWALTAVAATPGVLAFIALPAWILWVSVCVIRLARGSKPATVSV